ncbi:TPA: superantigen-like protein [Staphylococcus aureus]|nr:superantigen-like protein [Staphylococcus aureus]HDG8587431.1 superantigen-like protein [Staphylococcus aureus]HDZ3301119.1 superantigen-like protein [Staphylococcus aureus]HDZ3317701.1 superantigen-like protein [Staphylococcus aureus]HDZ3341199.1 superantigen-like protein [Staphylococcus aureus]
MKLKNIAKASLALGILTTGMITTTAQPVKASVQNSSLTAISNDTQKLKEYYTGDSFDYKNLKGYKEKNILTLFYYYQQIDVTLTGKEKIDLKKDDEVSNVDVFVVREGSGIQATNYTIGGVTKSNSKDYTDNVQSVSLKVKTETGRNLMSVSNSDYSINKEEISLKELDFKLRKHLIDKHDLYKTEPKDSKIRITMKDGGFYTFELNKKLQTHRMGDVIDGTKIKEINVELN